MLKKLILLLCSFCLPGFSQHDFSMWARKTPASSAIIPWYMYLGEDVTVDLRYNFDWHNTVGLFIGKQLQKGSIVLLPEFGLVTGEYNGISPELFLFGTVRGIDLWAQSQFVKGFGENPNFHYHWFDAVKPVSKNFSVGAGAQLFHLPNFAQVDIGPSFKITRKNLYIKIWPTISVGPDNRGDIGFFLGVGYVLP